ncbi:hypothetical protein F4804DRAFT_113394 [Jackrogersella minutella]|nr:hypothetical protein F4804DRAFT_113394 [Jackrogersella minutella]
MRNAEVSDAEVRAALEASKWALTRPAGAFHFCIDDTTEIRGLLRHPSDSTQAAALGFQESVAQLEQWSVQWSPGHMGIPGDEAADGEAKRGARPKEAEEADIPKELPTLMYLKRINKRGRKRICDNWWIENMPTRYRRWNLDTARTPKELQL